MDVHIYVNLSRGEYGFVQKQGTLNPVVKYDLSNKQKSHDLPFLSQC